MAGEGAAALVLERATVARRRGAAVLARVDGHGLAAAPGPNDLAATVARAANAALSASGCDGASVDLVIGCGRGRPAYDGAEAAGIAAALTGRAAPCPATALASALGVAEAASGLFAVVAALSALARQEAPPVSAPTPPDPPGGNLAWIGPGPRGGLSPRPRGRRQRRRQHRRRRVESAGDRFMTADGTRPAIVITGMGMITPIGHDGRTIVANLRAGRSAIAPISALDAPYLVAEVQDFEDDARTHEEDRATRMAKAAARLAVAEATRATGLDLSRIGIGVGMSGSGQYQNMRFTLGRGQARGPEVAYYHDRNVPHFQAQQLARMVGSTGPRVSACSASTGSAEAIGMAMRWLRAGKSSPRSWGEPRR